jgi:hypothetical protein
MFSKVFISVSAAFLLVTGVARAAPADAAYSAAESAIPDSIDYPNRVLDGRAPSNEAIEKLESGTPDSWLYRERMLVTVEITPLGWQVLESGNPNFP